MQNLVRLALSLSLVSPLYLVAQQPQPVTTSVIVLGSFDPISEGESERVVSVLDTQQQRLAFPEVTDYLRTDASVDIRQRGTGTQADVSLRGTSFEQTLVLLNGFRLNDVETSHFNLDIPVPLDALGAIDVLHGAGSTLYGSDAIGGVIDVLTYRPTASTLRFRAGFASFGGQQQALLLSGVRGRWSEVLAGEHDASQGFMPDRDYSSRQGSSETRATTALGETDILLAASDRPYGANLFYGDSPTPPHWDSWERTKGWFAGIHQQLGPQTSAALSYRRHTDEFLLVREIPSYYENNHIDQNWEATLRRADRLAKNVQLFYGLEEDTDQIRSTSLGNHGRNNGAGYAQMEWRLPSRATIAVGAREQVFSGGQSVFSPSASASYWLPHSVKLRAAAGHGFRQPTFLDLYYTDPSHLGNPNLKPEKAWNFEGGADWYASNTASASLTFFYDRQHDTIDYAKLVTAPPSAPYVATNLPPLRYLGIEASVTLHPAPRETMRFVYTGISGAPPVLNGSVSLYAASYAVNNASFEWTALTPKHDLQLRTRVGVSQHVGQTPYAVWDVEASRSRGWWRPYVQIANLSNTGYAEILLPSAVAMPPRSFAGGVEFELSRH